MALRVKCRCGQELTLRFSEWVYAIVVLLVLSLLVNGAALVYIAIRLDGGDRPKVPAPSEPSSEVAAPKGTSEEKPRPAEEEEASPPSGPVPGVAALASLEAPAAASEFEKPAASAAPSADTVATEARPAAGARPAARALFPDSRHPIERLLVLSRAEDLRLVSIFLGDDSPLVRRGAIHRAAGLPAPVAPAELREVLILALPAAPRFLADAGGREFLLRLGVEDRGSDPRAWLQWGQETLGEGLDRDPPETLLAPLRSRAEGIRSSSTGLRAIEGLMGPDGGKVVEGLDILFAIDATESMEVPLAELRKAGWLFPALVGGFSGLRVALLLYGDEVTATVSFNTDPSASLQALASAKAVGGGDVPEGVLEALKAALQLGRFHWRSQAAKHIVFVGDGPPPRAEIQALLSLVRQCHAEAGYRVHAVSVNPEGGSKPTISFPEMASAGGGQAATAPAGRVALEVFLAVFPPGARQELERMLPLLEAAGR